MSDKKWDWKDFYFDFTPFSVFVCRRSFAVSLLTFQYDSNLFWLSFGYGSFCVELFWCFQVETRHTEDSKLLEVTFFRKLVFEKHFTALKIGTKHFET